MQTIFSPTPRHRSTVEHPYYPAFIAAVARGSYDMGQFGEFAGYMRQKTDEGRAAELEDAEHVAEVRS